jgi:hypothetical protein
MACYSRWVGASLAQEHAGNHPAHRARMLGQCGGAGGGGGGASATTAGAGGAGGFPGGGGGGGGAAITGGTAGAGGAGGGGIVIVITDLVGAMTAAPIKFERFTTAGTAQTWTKESWAKSVRIILIGGGGPGGGGGRYAAATSASGGAGGGGGAVIDRIYSADQLGSTETYTVGAQVNGGAGATADTNAGGVGPASGSNTTFTINGVTLTAYGGGRGVRRHEWCGLWRRRRCRP